MTMLSTLYENFGKELVDLVRTFRQRTADELLQPKDRWIIKTANSKNFAVHKLSYHYRLIVLLSLYEFLWRRLSTKTISQFMTVPLLRNAGLDLCPAPAAASLYGLLSDSADSPTYVFLHIIIISSVFLLYYYPQNWSFVMIPLPLSWIHLSQGLRIDLRIFHNNNHIKIINSK